MLLKAPSSPSCAPMKGASLLPLFSEDLALPSQKRHSRLKTHTVPKGPAGISVWVGPREAAEAKGKPRAHRSHGGESTVGGAQLLTHSRLTGSGSQEQRSGPPQDLPCHDEDLGPG